MLGQAEGVAMTNPDAMRLLAYSAALAVLAVMVVAFGR